MKIICLTLLFSISFVQYSSSGELKYRQLAVVKKEVSILGWQQQIIQRAVVEFREQTGNFPEKHRITLYREGEHFLVLLLGVHRNPNAFGNSSDPRVPEMEIEVSADLNILNSNFVR